MSLPQRKSSSHFALVVMVDTLHLYLPTDLIILILDMEKYFPRRELNPGLLGESQIS